VVVDTSAIVAIVMDEAEAGAFARAILGARSVLIAAPTLLEVRLVLERRKSQEFAERLSETIAVLNPQIVAFGREHLQAAHDGYRRFGKGSGHPAQLNFGDCFAYALAKTTGLPLLFKGGDFARTDIIPAYA
jgi:ribonuclease VapC